MYSATETTTTHRFKKDTEALKFLKDLHDDRLGDPFYAPIVPIVKKKALAAGGWWMGKCYFGVRLDLTNKDEADAEAAQKKAPGQPGYLKITIEHD